MKRAISKRFIFEYEYYDADFAMQRMLHIKIFSEGATQTDLWLDEDDQAKLKETLEGDK